jgi:hypothetical protein
MRTFPTHNVILGRTLGRLALLSILIFVSGFARPSCDLAHSNNHLGGDWAGNVYSSSGCPGSCVGEFPRLELFRARLSEKRPFTDFVNNNPGAFSGAFFEFSWIKVYQ